MGKTLIIFDIDGTLLYSNKIDSQCFADTYQKIYKRNFPTIDWSKYPHVTDHVIFRTVIQDQFNRIPPSNEISDFQQAFAASILEKRKTAPHEFQEVPNAVNTINYLLNHEDYVVGIGTGGWHLPATIKLEHLGFKLDQIMISGADDKNSREEIIQVVLDKAQENHTIKRTTYIGDAPWDVQTTRNMNINFVGIRRKGDHEALLKMGATHVLSSYENQAQFLAAVNQAKPPK
ncbi:MAG: HAD family hydrolase [Bacteroidetes bacterium]|jgi:phosphoglycolate phosphatase-like HAD superfamily hydrolase|nr:HAD family hydrolase [Bacteroidota bacterium]